MSIAVPRFVNVLLEVSGITAIVAIPCLTALAYRSWSKHWRHTLSHLRRTLGTVSIAVTFLSWATYVGSFLLNDIGLNRALDSVFWLPTMVFMLATGIFFALTLRGPARVQTLFAGLLMILLLWTTVNF